MQGGGGPSLRLTREPDPGFFALAHAWAAGDHLDEVLDDEDLSGGDFVRNVQQLIDLLRQIGEVAPDPTTARTARSAIGRVDRGVVAAASTCACVDDRVDRTGRRPRPS